MKETDTNTVISEYYQLLGENAVFPNSRMVVLRSLLRGGKNDVIVSDSRILRGLAKVRGVKYISHTIAKDQSEQFLAFEDALLLLAKKGIPVYFYNRIGKKKDFNYSDSARIRMEKELNFPVMYNDISKYEEDLREIYGNKYSKEYVEALGKIPQVVKKGDYYCHEDNSSEFVNVINGKRITCLQPGKYSNIIHFYGRCGAFGYAVEDADTLPSQIQREFNERGLHNIKIENHGLWGGTDFYLDHNFIEDAVGMKTGDMVVFYRKHLDMNLIHQLENLGVWYKDITEEWHTYDAAKNCFFDKPGHMNHIGYGNVARLIVNDIVSHNFDTKKVVGEDLDSFQPEHLKEYLKSTDDDDFKEAVSAYVNDILKDHPLEDNNMKCGAIVMNCNPFTKGHRYLVDYASQKVDRLYIFVVEEDKSFFKFSDRFEMVENGTKDIENVVVVPSGRFIISTLTFPEYFMKDYVKEKDFDVSMDVEVFCKYIAPDLGISIRFVGEEPFDPVTANYNAEMRNILPEYGMEFCEIPRLALDEHHIVNATEVRRLLAEKNYEKMKEYVPDSTYEVLMEKYTGVC